MEIEITHDLINYIEKNGFEQIERKMNSIFDVMDWKNKFNNIIGLYSHVNTIRESHKEIQLLKPEIISDISDLTLYSKIVEEMDEYIILYLQSELSTFIASQNVYPLIKMVLLHNLADKYVICKEIFSKVDIS